jgi:hypothetical protein
LGEAGRKDEARRRLDSVLAFGPAAFPRSSRNLFLAQRLLLARNLDEFLRYAARVPAGITYNTDGQELPPELDPEVEISFGQVPKISPAGRPLFDADFAKLINERMPVDILKRAAASHILPPPIRSEVAIASWVRAILLNDEQSAAELTPILEDLAPAMKPYLRASLDLPTVESRSFGAIFLILRFPGVRPYVRAGLGRGTALDRLAWARDNWWCPWAPGAESPFPNRYWGETRISAPLMPIHPNGNVRLPVFINDGQRELAEKELHELQSLGTAPNYLAQQVMLYAKRYPDDPRIPEALHLVVRATREGCTNDETGNLSRAAFQLLKKRYGKSVWARKTKYWYRGL